MDYREMTEQLKKKDPGAGLILSVAQIQEELRRARLAEWVDRYPDDWELLLNPEGHEVDAKKAHEVMRSLQNFGQLELQVLWLFRFGNLLDVCGNEADTAEDVQP
ncbi:MAG: hypothetical protein Q4C65_12600 [Eubacteriales bacterium]|nr:hypothetical protein [Eubacteriales bacterium]